MFAKSLSGKIYSYEAETANEFKRELSLDLNIPIRMLKLFDEEGELDDHELSKDMIYYILLDIDNRLLDWVEEENLTRNILKNPEAIDWIEINIDRFDYQWREISENPGAIPFLEQNAKKINGDGLCRNLNARKLIEENSEEMLMNCMAHLFLSANQAAIGLLEKNQKHIVWSQLSRNPAAIHLLEQNPEKIDWSTLSSNPAAIHLLEENLDKVNWHYLSILPEAIHLLEQNPDKIYWKYLSANPEAIHLLESNLEKVDWHHLSKNPKALHILENNLEKINWYNLSKLPEAIPLLKKNQDKLDWDALSLNPGIFYPRESLRL